MIEAAHRNTDDIRPPRTPRLPLAICKPIADAQTLGMELYWTKHYTMVVTNNAGTPQFEFVGEKHQRPLAAHLEAPGYYRVYTGCQIALPRDFNGLILPHPRFFDHDNDMPAVIPSVLEMDWWPSKFSIVCSLPKPGAEHIFHADEPFCQVVPVLRTEIAIRPMDDAEEARWIERDELVASRNLSYTTLAGEVHKRGWQGIRDKYL